MQYAISHVPSSTKLALSAQSTITAHHFISTLITCQQLQTHLLIKRNIFKKKKNYSQEIKRFIQVEINLFRINKLKLYRKDLKAEQIDHSHYTLTVQLQRAALSIASLSGEVQVGTHTVVELMQAAHIHTHTPYIYLAG